jgi:hypothetical protein
MASESREVKIETVVLDQPDGSTREVRIAVEHVSAPPRVIQMKVVEEVSAPLVIRLR